MIVSELEGGILALCKRLKELEAENARLKKIETAAKEYHPTHVTSDICKLCAALLSKEGEE